MKATERLKRIEEAKRKMTQEAQDAITRDKLAKEEFYNKWLAHSQRIKDLLEVVDGLCKNNIPIGKIIMDCGIRKHQFISEGFYHRFGFVALRYENQSKDLNIIGVGRVGGGMCGTDFVLNEEGVLKFSKYFCTGFGSTTLKPIYCFEELEQQFLDFEREFYEYVDSL